MSISRAKFFRQVYPFKPPSTSVDHLVIGGGVIGLSVAAALVNQGGKDRTTFLVERRGQLGQETTARNSEVIHSGIYYPLGSVKSRLCIQGRDMLYRRCEQFDIGHKRTGKIVVATSDSQVPYLQKLQAHSTHSSFLTTPGDLSSSRIATRFLCGNEARELEPDLSPKVCGALLIPSTGIVDSQGLVDSLEREVEDPDYNPSASRVEDRGEGVIVLGTRVVRIDREKSGNGWVVQMETGWEGLEEGEKGEVESVRADVVVNAAGLGSVNLCEGVVPESELAELWPVKGNYMSYKGPGIGNVSRLIYPCPSANVDHLGTHLTLDLDGHIKFGPDVQTIGTSADAARDPDFWQSHLAPASSPERIAAFARSIQDYLPTIDPSLLSPDYAGIRPNIAPPEAGFSDFLIRHVEQRKGFIELLGFNSPGLTSSLAVGEVVGGMVGRQVWNKKD
ncbi:FAD dependent oxidoreductase [Cryptococcus neoformans Tu401-1]|nr:FAD dependent oxidoreductase [Cryptococcus neoformans var. grubii Tu401-1]